MSKASRIWSGCFLSREEAVSLSEGDGNLWANPKWQVRQEAILSTSNFSSSWQTLPRPTSLPLLTANRIVGSLVDFGGSSGWVYQKCRDVGARFDKYTVIEVPEIVARFSAAAPPGVSYQTIEEYSSTLEEPLEIFYSNATLQYLNSLDVFFEFVYHAKPRAILIDELLWTKENSDWYSIQTNSDMAMVVRFVSIAALRENLESLGYKFVWSQGALAADSSMEMPDMSHFAKNLQISARLSAYFVVA